MKDKKTVDIAPKKMQNSKNALSTRILSYLDGRRAGDFSSLAPEGCIIQCVPIETADVLVAETGVFSYFKFDPEVNKKFPNITIDEQGRAIYTYKCNYKTNQAGNLDTEVFALLVAPLEDYNYFQTLKAEHASSIKHEALKAENKATTGIEED